MGYLLMHDFGTYGTTYPIAEENIIEVLKNRFNNAEFEKKEKWVNAFQKTVERPKGRALPRAQCERKFSFDPSITAEQDIRDGEGKIVVGKGTRINPLDKHSVSVPLLFFDGTDDEQLNWAQETEGLWIITEGNPIALESQQNRPVYFDQGGFLTRKMGINALPARVTQDKTLLSIEEIPCL